MSRYSVEAVFRAVDRITAPVTRMQNSVGKLGRQVESVARGMDKKLRSVGEGAKSLVVGVAGVGAAATGVGVLLDKITRADLASQQLASSVGVSVKTLEALGGAVSSAGFDYENIVDLAEELNNKVGESIAMGATTPAVKDAMGILGIDFKEFSTLDTEKQLTSVLNKALQMDDIQASASAVDILMGGEANKILGVLRQQGKTADEIIQKFGAVSHRTEESRRGAEAFQRALGAAKLTVYSIVAEFAGLAGGNLSDLVDSANAWASANKSIIASGVRQFAMDFSEALIWVVSNYKEISIWAERVAVGVGVFLALTTALKTLVLVSTALNIVLAANPIVWLVAAIGLLIAAAATLVYYWDEVSSAFRNANSGIDLLITGVSLATGPVGWLVGAAALLYRHWETVAPTFRGVGESIGLSAQTAQTAWKIAQAFFSYVFNAVSSGASSMSAGVSGAASRIAGWAKRLMSAWASVGAFFGNIFNSVVGRVDSIVGKVNRVRSAIASVGRFAGISVSSRGSRGGSDSTVTIRDETRRASVTAGKLASGVALKRSGGM